MSQYKIECFEFENEEYVPITEDITLEDSGACYRTFTVKCDEEFDNNSFTVSSYGDDEFVINRNRCDLDVYIKPNLTPYQKEFHIILTHAQDSNVFFVLNIIQPGEVYELSLDDNADLLTKDYINKEDSSISKTIAEFEEMTDNEKEKYRARYTLLLKKEVNTPFPEKSDDINYNYYEEKRINVTISGGSNKFKIKSLLRYDVKEDEDNENTILQSKFDNGFIYTLSTDYLEIRNYGMPFLNINNYYEMVLCHANLRELNIVLRINYVEQRTRKTKKKKQAKIKPITVEHAKTDVYLSKSELKKRYIKERKVVEKVNYELSFDEEVENPYIIKGVLSDIAMPFSVYENGEESNLMVAVFSSATWCIANTDETNRILTIRIKNKPLCERKSLVKVYIIDKPSVCQTFTIINKPHRK